MKRAVWGLALVACYRDAGEPVQNPEPGVAPMVIQAPAAKCGADDLAQPVVDVNPGGRLRTHRGGPLTTAGTWIGPAVPATVPTNIDTLELFIADAADGGTLALYREPYNRKSCALSGHKNCAYEAQFYDKHGLAWSLHLNDILSMKEHLEVQDIRLAGGVLYFNEACQSYAQDANMQCSRLVAVDPARKKVLWRTDPLTSNGRFRVRGCYIVAGYGFTAEPDNMFVVDRGSGRVVQTFPVSSSPEVMTLAAADQLEVTLYSGVKRSYRMDGFDGAKAQLVSLDQPEQFGGASYGGVMYGGATYGVPARKIRRK
jgi:hypothetical protein